MDPINGLLETSWGEKNDLEKDALDVILIQRILDDTDVEVRPCTMKKDARAEFIRLGNDHRKGDRS